LDTVREDDAHSGAEETMGVDDELRQKMAALEHEVATLREQLQNAAHVVREGIGLQRGRSSAPVTHEQLRRLLEAVARALEGRRF
jgi:hypothetical protein